MAGALEPGGCSELRRAHLASGRGEVAHVIVSLEMGWRTAFLPSLEAFLCSGGVGQKKQCEGTKTKE